MNDAHVYEMQVQMWKPNTWGVIDTIMAKPVYAQDLRNLSFPSSNFAEDYKGKEGRVR